MQTDKVMTNAGTSNPREMDAETKATFEALKKTFDEIENKQTRREAVETFAAFVQRLKRADDFTRQRGANALDDETRAALDDVIDEILMTGETLTGAKLDEWISRYPQFAQDLTDYAVFDAVSDFIDEPEPLTEPEQTARLARSQNIAADVVKSKLQNASVDIKTVDTSNPCGEIQTDKMPKFLTFYADVIIASVPRRNADFDTGFFLFRNSADADGSKLILMPRERIKDIVYKLHAQFESEKAN